MNAICIYIYIYIYIFACRHCEIIICHSGIIFSYLERYTCKIFFYVRPLVFDVHSSSDIRLIVTSNMRSRNSNLGPLDSESSAVTPAQRPLSNCTIFLYIGTQQSSQLWGLCYKSMFSVIYGTWPWNMILCYKTLKWP